MDPLTLLIAVAPAFAGGIAAGAVGLYFRLRSAPYRYVRRIRRQIEKAYSEGPSNAIVNARIIVGSRNALFDSLQALGNLLNSELDRLEAMIYVRPQRASRTPSQPEGPNPQAIPEAVYEQIRVLRDYWSAREDTVATSIKKVLVDLGIL